ncbi:PREDICTED: G-type lectin S-receptor-like serine/threonine-protein kinase CES101 isoform X2 [Ipomoea nil]|uniref:G-type lectin S-receptor-like serine/threonine-protein kinase CES101 isoform X2 n=1 Tax=Ipomoea nil TaxID=35883 RepID=UPI0009016820|nr:PREDICTED: G-type lectin S-receptor-like serine/threonine-protein kinase CES101 isoform X2 [Ipomoea nil]
MKLGLSGTDTQTPSNRALTSWISDGNPSPGGFELGMNPNQTNELIIKRRGVVYWRSGEWKRQNFTFLDFPAGSGANMTNYSSAKKAYFSLSGGSQVGNGYSFIRLNSRGGIDAFIWNATTKTVEPLVVVVCDPDEALRRRVALSGGCSASSKKAPPPASAPAPAIAPATPAERTWNWRKHLARWKLAAIVSLVVAIVIALSAVSIFNRFKKRRGYRRAQSKLTAKQDSKITEKGDNELRLYNLATIKIATDYFSRGNMLGRGGFGVVYLGKLANGEEIAVKRLSKLSGLGVEQFHNEVVLISKLQHRNLVKILGCCMEENECILIYEYLPNKSLDSILFDPTIRALLCWKTRINIIQGVAQGLLYLHTYSRLRVIH